MANCKTYYFLGKKTFYKYHYVVALCCDDGELPERERLIAFVEAHASYSNPKIVLNSIIEYLSNNTAEQVANILADYWDGTAIIKQTKQPKYKLTKE